MRGCVDGQEGMNEMPNIKLVAPLIRTIVRSSVVLLLYELRSHELPTKSKYGDEKLGRKS